VTTAGRALFADVLHPGMPFYNCALGKKGCARVIDDAYAFAGRPGTIDLLDAMKEIGFKQSAIAGLSFGITDLRIPETKTELLADSDSTFFIRNGGISVVFRRDREGRGAAVTIDGSITGPRVR